MNYKEIEGNIILEARKGIFDVVVQGNNCLCTQGAGLAPQFVKEYSTDKFRMEQEQYKGDINKLGTIDFEELCYEDFGKGIFKWVRYPDENRKWVKHSMFVVNAYTQFNYGRNHADGDQKPVDYDAITLVMRKINHVFKGKRIGLPKISAGLAGGDWNIIKSIIQEELKDCNVTIVIYNK
jgi:O-acetyl-ADP-ribose deacetylase (regulator of RNase III)